MSIPRGSIHEYIFQSKELNEEIELLIYLPANFSPLYKYTLLIVQDGRDYIQLGRICRLADEYIFEKQIENLIIVGLPYKNVKDRRRKYHPDGEQNEAYIRFLAHELVPYLDKEFPTYQMGSTRALLGSSLGASVSLMTALKYPHTFGKVLLQSPFVNEKVIEAVKNCRQEDLLQIYHSVGNEETEVRTTDGKTSNFIEPNRRLSGVFSQKPFSYQYEEMDGSHSWTFWQPNLKRVLKAMF